MSKFKSMKKIVALLTVLLCGYALANAQTRTITGRVVDSTDRGIAGASIVIKGTTTGVAAGPDGSFSIPVRKGDVLTITAVNYAPTDVAIADQPNLNVVLTGTTGVVDEVVVTALGIRRSRNTLPYAAQQVSSTEITKTRTNNFGNALSGKVAGLQIKTNNNLGGSTN